MSRSLLDYYSRRAAEYERVYEKSERHLELGALTLLLRQLLAGEDVLEIACGTGYWTAAIAPVARSILATDAGSAVLELARHKSYPKGRVRFEAADAYEPGAIEGRFTAGFAGFWWSHVPRERLPRFLAALHARLGPGARVVFCDNRYVEGSSSPVTREDPAGNTFQQRHLENGYECEVLKNFPSAEEVRGVIRSHGGRYISRTELTYYWCVGYRISPVPLEDRSRSCDRSP